MNEELIKRIDEQMNAIRPYDKDGYRSADFDIHTLLQDCRAEINRLTLALKDSQALNLKFAQDREAADAEIERLSEPVLYVPMTEAEFDELSAQWPGEDEVKIYCWEKHIEREVIRRAIAQGAKLEVQE